MFIKDNRNEIEYEYRIPELTPIGSNIAIQGNFDIKISGTGITDESSSQKVDYNIYVKDSAANKIAIDAGFTWIGTKVTTFAELYAVYFKEAANTLFDGPRQHPPRLSTEDCSIEKANLDSFDIHSIASKRVSLKYSIQYP